MGRTYGEPDESKKNTHPKCVTEMCYRSFSCCRCCNQCESLVLLYLGLWIAIEGLVVFWAVMCMHHVRDGGFEGTEAPGLTHGVIVWVSCL